MPKALYSEGTEKLPLFCWEFSYFYINSICVTNLLQSMQGKAFPYCITSSVSLVILLTFATNAVVYICSSMANSPLESSLRNPWASFISPFFSSIRFRIFIRSLKYSLYSNFSRSRFFSFPAPFLSGLVTPGRHICPGAADQSFIRQVAELFQEQ